ncbi:helix-turn-helix domain-containing protein [Actinomycetes bacterium KLBMP 9759]
MARRRSSDDPCGIARAMEVIGERWATHVVRELMLGPKRFSDLVRGLPGVSQNVLSQRLRELADSGVLRRRRAGPPVSAHVYELTERGYELRPVLIALSRWGSRQATTASGELSADALAIAMLVTFDGAHADDVTVELRLGDDRFRAEIRGGEFDIARVGAGRVETGRVETGRVGAGRVETGRGAAVIEADSATLRSVVFGGRPLDPATVTGDLDAARAFVRHFPRPAVT